MKKEIVTRPRLGLTIYLIVICLFFSFCTSQKKSGPSIGYDLKKPLQQWKLPKELKEISGIVKLGGDSLLAIEDLHANLYYLKLGSSDATITANLPFAENQKDKFDIEDVTAIGDTVYALWSHASVFKIWNWRTKIQSKEFETSLDKKNNTEGIAFDPVTGNLLIACKNESGNAEEKKSTRAIYEFDVRTGKLRADPFLLIEKKDFKKFVADKVEFFPSGIAVHPTTHDLYVISTKGNKCIACFSHSGQLKSFEYLDKDLLPQPEGICFDKEGNLYISTEGKSGQAPFIYKFGKIKGK